MIVNHNLNHLTPAEIGQIVAAHRYRLTFSNGMFEGSNREQWEEWDGRMKRDIYFMDFETGAEEGPVLSEILNALQHIWDE